MIKRIINRILAKYFDYEIIGEYYAPYFDEKKGMRIYKKQYVKKYHLKRR